ncbi:MAG: CHRD domain-containing protein [Chloroflexota bacterium]
MKASNEVPPITNAEAAGTGKGTFTLDVTRDSAGKITAAKGTLAVTLSGFPATVTPIVGFHIHNAPAGTNAGVVVNSGVAASAPVQFTSGSATITKADITVDPALAELIIANPAGYYFNAHTQLNPGGAVRGQLVKF